MEGSLTIRMELRRKDSQPLHHLTLEVIEGKVKTNSIKERLIHIGAELQLDMVWQLPHQIPA